MSGEGPSQAKSSSNCRDEGGKVYPQGFSALVEQAMSDRGETVVVRPRDVRAGLGKVMS